MFAHMLHFINVNCGIIFYSIAEIGIISWGFLFFIKHIMAKSSVLKYAPVNYVIVGSDNYSPSVWRQGELYNIALWGIIICNHPCHRF